jgi:hypothetical protein
MQLEVILFMIAIACGVIQILKLAVLWDRERDEE